MKEFDYSDFAEFYDVIEDSRSMKTLNNFLVSFFNKNNVTSILDMTCGTGLQSIFLDKKGYDVTASDLNPEMLEIARSKYTNLKFHEANMIDVKFNKSFDAIISMFNAIGHLTSSEFELTLSNVYSNLKSGGFYIFDIFNFEAMVDNFISNEFIDICKEVEGIKYVRFNDNSLDKLTKVMKINQTTYIEKGVDKIKTMKGSWEMKIYSVEDLLELIKDKGFELIDFLNIKGEELDRKKNISILAIIKKV